MTCFGFPSVLRHPETRFICGLGLAVQLPSPQAVPRMQLDTGLECKEDDPMQGQWRSWGDYLAASPWTWLIWMLQDRFDL